MAHLGEYTSCWGVMGKGWAAFRAGLVVGYQAVGTCPNWLGKAAQGFMQGWLNAPHVPQLLQHL